MNADFGRENPNFMGNIMMPTVLNLQILSAFGVFVHTVYLYFSIIQLKMLSRNE